MALIIDVTTDGVLDHIDIPLSFYQLSFAEPAPLQWWIYEAGGGSIPLYPAAHASGSIPNIDIDGSVSIQVASFGLHYHNGDEFALVVQGDASGLYDWPSYYGADAPHNRWWYESAGFWNRYGNMDNSPSTYSSAFSTFFAVPEPTTAALLLLGILGCIGTQRRNRCAISV
ncbi:MAG TPA: PEP-CTERM sorting domain-containing protein [Terriglobales bacterium]|nr:PEP-CTERM sorting domain-containing protein [Terriglobales bacterium]